MSCSFVPVREMSKKYANMITVGTMARLRYMLMKLVDALLEIDVIWDWARETGDFREVLHQPSM